MEQVQKSRIRTDYWYRKGYKEGAWFAYFFPGLPVWGVLFGVTVPFALWLKWASPIAWLLWTYPIWFAAMIWFYFKWLDWHYPLTK